MPTATMLRTTPTVTAARFEKLAGRDRSLALARVDPVGLDVDHVVDEVHRPGEKAEGDEGDQGLPPDRRVEELAGSQRCGRHQEVLGPLPWAHRTQHGQDHAPESRAPPCRRYAACRDGEGEGARLRALGQLDGGVHQHRQPRHLRLHGRRLPHPRSPAVRRARGADGDAAGDQRAPARSAGDRGPADLGRAAAPGGDRARGAPGRPGLGARPGRRHVGARPAAGAGAAPRQPGQCGAGRGHLRAADPDGRPVGRPPG